MFNFKLFFGFFLLCVIAQSTAKVVKVSSLKQKCHKQLPFFFAVALSFFQPRTTFLENISKIQTGNTKPFWWIECVITESQFSDPRIRTNVCICWEWLLPSTVLWIVAQAFWRRITSSWHSRFVLIKRCFVVAFETYDTATICFSWHLQININYSFEVQRDRN